MKLKVEGEADGQPKAASTHYRSVVRFHFVQASAHIIECSTDFKPGFDARLLYTVAQSFIHKKHDFNPVC